MMRNLGRQPQTKYITCTSHFLEELENYPLPEEQQPLTEEEQGAALDVVFKDVSFHHL